MAILKHELWQDSDGLLTFCLAGEMGNGARGLLSKDAALIWTVDAESHFQAMTLYYAKMGYGKYTSEHEWDFQPYPDEWLEIQRRSTA